MKIPLRPQVLSDRLDQLRAALLEAGFSPNAVASVTEQALLLPEVEQILAGIRRDYPSAASPHVEYLEGKPFLRPGQVFSVTNASDCIGDGEAEMRADPYAEELPRGARVKRYQVAELNKFHLGFILAGAVYENILAADPRRPQISVYIGNAAPRAGHTPDAAAPPFVFAELKPQIVRPDLGETQRIFYFGTFGEELSRFVPLIAAVWELGLKEFGFDAATVYRSRFLEGAVARWAKGDLSGVLGEVNPNLIPESYTWKRKSIDSFETRVGHVDRFGNIKTTIPSNSEGILGLERGATLMVQIGEAQPQAVRLGLTLGDAERGQLVLAPGSTRHWAREEGFFNFMDIYCNGGKAAPHFAVGGHLPVPGDSVLVQKIA